MTDSNMWGNYMKKYFTFYLVFALLATSSWAESKTDSSQNSKIAPNIQAETIESLSDFKKKIEKYIPNQSVSKTLVVFDIDHTLLHPRTDLGSSYWFKWQAGLLQTLENEPEQIAATYDELNEITCKIFETVPFVTVEKSAPKVFAEIVKESFPVIFLTARSPRLQRATLKQLSENDFDIKSLTNAPQLSHSVKLTQLEKRFAGLTEQNPVLYSPQGVMFSNEQDKGTILKAFLQRSGVHYDNIVLVDDSEKNVLSLQKAFANDSETKVITFFYTRDHNKFKDFGEKLKSHAAREYDIIKEELTKVECAN